MHPRQLAHESVRQRGLLGVRVTSMHNARPWAPAFYLRATGQNWRLGPPASGCFPNRHPQTSAARRTDRRELPELKCKSTNYPAYRAGPFGFHSRNSFFASASCSRVILDATTLRL